MTIEGAMKKRLRTAGLAVAAGAALAGAPAFPALADTGGGAVAVYGYINGKWAAMAGASLRETLEGWCNAAGWTLVWDNPYDYRLRASASFTGSFEDAVRSLIDAIYLENPEITADLKRGNKVVWVQENSLVSN